MAEAPSARQLVRLLEVVHQLHETADRTAFGAVAARCVGGLVAADSVAVNAVDTVRGAVDGWDWPPDSLEGGSELLAERMHEHPAITHFFSRPDPHARSIRELADRRSWQATSLHADLFGPLGIVDQLVATVTLRGSAGIGFGINRSRVGFDAADRQLVALLRPHLSQAYAHAVFREDVSAVLGAPVADAFGLTPREQEVLLRVAGGETDAEVARALVLSTSTVRKHLENSYRKLGVRSRTAAVARLHAVGGDLTIPRQRPPG